MLIENDTPLQFFGIPGQGPSDKPVLTLVVKGTFIFDAGGQVSFSDEQLPLFFGDEMQDPEKGGSTRFEDDIATFKPRTDVVMVGKAVSSSGAPVHVVDAGFRVGPIKKIVRVFGDRYWLSGGVLGEFTPSDPRPFEAIDLIYENAFGGMDIHSGQRCADNPVGRGIASPKENKEDMEMRRLPNIEDPNHCIKSWKDRPRPVGFGFVGKGWGQRVGFLGTYDEKWKNERYPERPLDFQFDFFNAAPPDQQVEGYLKGDEPVELYHVTPEGQVSFQLPGRQPRVSISRSFEEEQFEEVVTRLDTLCLLPSEKRFYVVWRGLVPIAELNAPDVMRVRISYS